MPAQQLSLFEIEPPAQNRTIEEFAQALGFTLGPRWPDDFGTALQRWATQTMPQSIKTLSLFSGGGGLDIGFHDAGFAIQTMLEIELSFEDWIDLQLAHNDDKHQLAMEWLLALSETLCQKRRDRAPIDEPADAWVAELQMQLRRWRQSLREDSSL